MDCKTPILYVRRTTVDRRGWVNLYDSPLAKTWDSFETICYRRWLQFTGFKLQPGKMVGVLLRGKAVWTSRRK